MSDQQRSTGADAITELNETSENQHSIELLEARLKIMQLRDFAIGEAAKSS